MHSKNLVIDAIVDEIYLRASKNIEYEKEGILNANIKPRNGHTPLSKYGYDILYVIMFILFLVSAIYYNLRVFRR